MPMSPQPAEHKNRIAFSDLGRKSDLGANWDNGVRAGLFACYLYHAASNAGTTIGCRLATRARSRLFMEGRTARDLGFALRSGQKNRRNTNRAGVASSLRANVAPTPYLGCKPDLGASWVDGVRAGLFACNLNNPASNANTNIGCRLAIRARSRLFMESRTARDLGFAFRSGQENRRNTNRAGAASSLRASAAPAPMFWGAILTSARIGRMAFVRAFSPATCTMLRPMRVRLSVAASQLAPEAVSLWRAGQRATWGLRSAPGKRTGETRTGPGRPVACG